MLPEGLFHRKGTLNDAVQANPKTRQPKSPTDPLKLHLSDATGRNIISGYGQGYIEINGERHVAPIVVGPSHLDTAWPDEEKGDIGPETIRRLASLQAEIVLIGTGPDQRFPAPATLRPLVEAGLGFEVMNTHAACRTYNILVAEDRKVAAALIP